MTITEGGGLVQWSHAIGLATAYTIHARASNIIGRVDVTWTIEVPLSYSSQVTCTDPSGVMQSPRSIRITGSIAFVPGAFPRVVPVDVKVTSLATNRVTILPALSILPNFDIFRVTYYPRPDDIANFSVVRTSTVSADNSLSFHLHQHFNIFSVIQLNQLTTIQLIKLRVHV